MKRTSFLKLLSLKEKFQSTMKDLEIPSSVTESSSEAEKIAFLLGIKITDAFLAAHGWETKEFFEMKIRWGKILDEEQKKKYPTTHASLLEAAKKASAIDKNDKEEILKLLIDMNALNDSMPITAEIVAATEARARTEGFGIEDDRSEKFVEVVNEMLKDELKAPSFATWFKEIKR